MLLIICINSLTAQNQKTIDKKGGSIYYGNYAKELRSEKSLPENVQSNLKGYLNKILPTIIDSITFSHGQIIDLKKMFEKEPSTYNNAIIIPTYDLSFYLKNRSIGVKNYYLEIKLDEYGQILETNWPKETLVFEKFKTLTEIETAALKHITSKNIEYQSYKFDLIYKKETDKLFWIITFLTKTEGTRNEYYEIEFPWNSLKISDEGFGYQQIVN